jgi:hypothetical protein
VRSPSGKPDYRWGKATAVGALAEDSDGTPAGASMGS